MTSLRILKTDNQSVVRHEERRPIVADLMMRNRRVWVPLIFFLVSVFGSSTANATLIRLTYTGNSFDTFYSFGTLPPDVYTTSDRVSGFIELADPLGANLTAASIAPVVFRFTDGVNTISNEDATSILPSSFVFWTDSSAEIVNWAINLFEVRPGVLRRTVQSLYLPGTLGVDTGQSVLCGSVVDCIDSSGNLTIDPFYVQQARLDAAPGVWTATTTAIPEPAALALVGAALAGVTATRRRRPATTSTA